MTAAVRRLPLLVALLLLPSTASAHRLDEYLQSTLVAVEPDRVRLMIHLTPGVDVAGQVLALVDRDHDGTISASEAVVYGELVHRDLVVRLDQRTVELQRTAWTFPAPSELRIGSGIIKLEFSSAPDPLAPGAHRLTIQNRHLPAVGVYLLNAARPKVDSIEITQQHRNDNQSEGEIGFNVRPAGTSPVSIAIIVSLLGLLAVGVALYIFRRRRGTVQRDPDLG